MIPVSDGVLHSFDIKDVLKHLAFGAANKGLFDIKSIEGFYNVKYVAFRAGGLRWQICVYPYDDYLEIYLHLLDKVEANIKYNYMLIVRDMNTSQWKVDSKGALPNGTDFIADDFGAYLTLSMVRIGSIHRTDILNYVKNDGYILLKLALWFVVDKGNCEEHAGSQATEEHHQQDLPGSPADVEPLIGDPNEEKGCTSDSWISALLTGEFSDVLFIVKGQKFAVHRAVLAARSSVFRSEFLALRNKACENNVAVSIQHMDPTAFKYLLHFIYADSLPSDIEEASSSKIYHLLFIAAHRFKIEGLKLLCEKKLTKVVTDTIVTTLDLMDHQECGLLKIIPTDNNLNTETSMSIL